MAGYKANCHNPRFGKPWMHFLARKHTLSKQEGSPWPANMHSCPLLGTSHSTQQQSCTKTHIMHNKSTNAAIMLIQTSPGNNAPRCRGCRHMHGHGWCHHSLGKEATAVYMRGYASHLQVLDMPKQNTHNTVVDPLAVCLSATGTTCIHTHQTTPHNFTHSTKVAASLQTSTHTLCESTQTHAAGIIAPKWLLHTHFRPLLENGPHQTAQSPASMSSTSAPLAPHCSQQKERGTPPDHPHALPPAIKKE